MNPQYTIYIVNPPGYLHSRTFQEIAEGLSEGFAELGRVVPIVYDVARIVGRGIVLGGHLLPQDLPPRCIVYNLEQWRSGWMNSIYLDLLRQHEVWDYSYDNIEQLKSVGITAKFCGIGYEPCLTRIAPQEEDVDVLFYGSIFGRRVPILEAVEATGLKVKRLFGVYGEERDQWIARSKIVLNLHAYDNAPLEITRLSYLWANKRFIVSEGPVVRPWNECVVQGTPSLIPQLCQNCVDDKYILTRQAVAQRGFRVFSATRQSAYLRPLLTDQ